jgi:acetyltransferase-like isoleucine patch superfamily enzyme
MKSVKNKTSWTKPLIKEGKLTRWNWMIQHVQNFKCGKRVDIGAFTYINARYGVEIMDDVKIGSHCSIYSHSTIDNKKGKIVVGRGAKIGTHATIMPGVAIGKNAIVGAYSFVKNDVPENVLVVGVPAKIKINE